MEFYLKEPYGPELPLPVNPIGEVKIRREKQYETINIINIGEIDFANGEKVKEITFSSFFPKEYDPSYCKFSDLPDPQEAMNQLTAWAIGNKPVRFQITETIIDALVLVAVHETTLAGGEPGDVYYDLTLRTWREIKVRTAAEAAAVVPSAGVVLNQQRSRNDLKPVPKKREVKQGDTLWAIAKLEYGDGSKWHQIYEANKSLIGPSSELITPGMKLVMPA